MTIKIEKLIGDKRIKVVGKILDINTEFIPCILIRRTKNRNWQNLMSKNLSALNKLLFMFFIEILFSCRWRMGQNASATASTSSRLLSVPLSNLHALIIAIIIFSACCASFGLVDSILLITYPNTALIVTQIVDTSINIIVYHLTCLQESLLDVECSFCRCLQEYQSIFLCKSLSFLCAYLSSVVQICFVANQHNHNVRITILSNFFQPPSQMIKRFFACNIVDQESPCSTSVVASGYTFERFLPCSVPYLKFYVFVINFNSTTTEFYANCQVMLLTEALVRELQKQT